MCDLSGSDVKKKIGSLANPSTPLQTKKSDVEQLLNFCVKNKDFAQVVKESDGVLVLITLFKTINDVELKGKLTLLIFCLSLSGHSGAPVVNMMNDINVLSLVNLFLEKDFGIYTQAFAGLKVLGEPQGGAGVGAEVGAGGSAAASGIPSKLNITFNVSTATFFLENFTSLVSPSSKLLTDDQRMKLLISFTQFVKTGVLAPAAAEAAKDSASALSKRFSLAYGNFVKTLETCHKGDFSGLDMITAQMLQLVKENKLIAALTVPVQLSPNLEMVISLLGSSKKYNLLYQGSKDGYGSVAFHQKCDNKGPTVTIITSTEGHVFGGYAAVAWNGEDNYVEDHSKQSFLFSLKNPRNAQPANFSLADVAYALYSNSAYGPTFGNYDIYFANNNDGTSYTSLGGSYSNPTGLDGSTVFTGQYNFTARDIEVYQVQ